MVLLPQFCPMSAPSHPRSLVPPCLSAAGATSALTRFVTQPEGLSYNTKHKQGQAVQKDVTWLPDFMSFMFMAFFMPLPFSFLFFFFLQQHFLQMQKQQVRMRSPATTAMAMRAQGGTAGKDQCHHQPHGSLPVPATPMPCPTRCTETRAVVRS